jgi:rod shape-determining protein MreD
MFGIATPLTYLYFILLLPSSTNRNLLIFLGFILGLSIDFFSYTLGIHAMASTIAGFSRNYSLKLFSPRDMPNEYNPSVRSFGFEVFLKYSGFIILLHHVVYFTVESLSLFDPLSVLMRIAGSFLLTMAVILAFEGINSDILKK